MGMTFHLPVLYLSGAIGIGLCAKCERLDRVCDAFVRFLSYSDHETGFNDELARCLLIQ
jgi:hypothetical protein